MQIAARLGIILVKQWRKPTIFNTAFVDDYACLTDIAAGENFPMRTAPRVTNLLPDATWEGRTMPQVDRSTNILTGMIIAALYVILLVGFVRESYTYRDATQRESDRMTSVYWRDVPKNACRIDLALCRPSEAMAASRPRDIWQAMREDP